MFNKVPWIFETCGRCGRPLKTEKSRELGYGPVCIRKIEAERERQQTTIDDYLTDDQKSLLEGYKAIKHMYD
jgi:Family of unknown function (DUF6011)